MRPSFLISLASNNCDTNAIMARGHKEICGHVAVTHINHFNLPPK